MAVDNICCMRMGVRYNFGCLICKRCTEYTNACPLHAQQQNTTIVKNIQNALVVFQARPAKAFLGRV